MASYLVVIYGAPLTGKSAVAWQLAQSLPGKTAVVSFDALIQGAIAVRSEDEPSELNMVHTQARLLAANYMKNGYHVVVEGPFGYHREGRLRRFEQDIGQLIALMRQMTRRALSVQLTAAPQEIERRAAEAGRPEEVPEALALMTSYQPRYGGGAMTVDTTGLSIGEVARTIAARLLAGEFA